ncbi:MAG: carboxypeptidase regulatory-like domain-containing protein, partial [Mucilaginibacter sp.]
MKFRSLLILSATLLFFTSTAFAQRDSIPLSTIIDKANKSINSHPVEKVYLHFDKPYYAIGDTIWYKAYLTYGLHQPSELSRIIYVDIINSHDQAIETQMLTVKNGSAIGSISLTQPGYDQDSYHIRAYTRWMTNFDKAYFFNKTIVVGNAINKQVSTVISIRRTANTGEAGINTTITYKDTEGNAYADKKVQWTITNNSEDIAKGKGVTDAQGKLNIIFPNTASVDLAAAVLNTVLDAGNRKIINNSFPLKSAALPADVQFFPEGGNLVNNILCRIAIKAIQSNGLSTDFSATITDNTGAAVTTCNSEHAGMGQFMLTPQAGKTYKASVTFKDGTKDVYELPQAQTGGMAMGVVTTDTSRLIVKISVDETYLKSHLNKIFYLVGKIGPVICYAAKLTLMQPEVVVFIPTDKLPTGLIQLTLLTALGQPISERL